MDKTMNKTTYKITHIIDMDEVIVDFVGEMCNKYEMATGVRYCIDDFLDYNMKILLGDFVDNTFKKEGYFVNLKPFDGAIEMVEQLVKDGDKVIIATDALGVPIIAYEKLMWLDKYMPFIPKKNIMIGGCKSDLKGDIMFDDNLAFLDNFDGFRVVNDRPYNRKANYTRIFNNNFSDYYKLTKEYKADMKNYFQTKVKIKLNTI